MSDVIFISSLIKRKQSHFTRKIMLADDFFWMPADFSYAKLVGRSPLPIGGRMVLDLRRYSPDTPSLPHSFVPAIS